MPEGPDGKTIIIVKKVAGHGGHHGGAWKVAYADFITAMMALFLVLWLVNSATVRTREAIASYFQRPGVFDTGSGTPVELGGMGILQDSHVPATEGDNQQVMPSKEIYNTEMVTENEEGFKQDIQQLEMEVVADEIQASLSKYANTGGSPGGLLGQVNVMVDQRGLHLEIMDTEKASMFRSGSAQILSEAQAELVNIARILVKLPNPIDIEGHTDATPFRDLTSKRYDNWNLSTDRANAARRILEDAGFKDEQIARVVGYAAQRPKRGDDPKHASNRRITISMRFSEQAAKELEGSLVEKTKSKPIGAIPGSGKGPDEASAEHKLELELSTSLPDGQEAKSQVPGADEPSKRSPRVKQDKIFGEDPFFGR